jgi:hypothetical protein
VSIPSTSLGIARPQARIPGIKGPMYSRRLPLQPSSFDSIPSWRRSSFRRLLESFEKNVGPSPMPLLGRLPRDADGATRYTWMMYARTAWDAYRCPTCRYCSNRCASDRRSHLSTLVHLCRTICILNSPKGKLILSRVDIVCSRGVRHAQHTTKTSSTATPLAAWQMTAVNLANLANLARTLPDRSSV